MVTKYNTGQQILIPAIIRTAREENNKIIYEVDVDYWEGIPEDQIIVNDKTAEISAFATGIKALTADLRDRYNYRQ